MINKNDLPSKISYSKDLINEQDFKNLTVEFNTAGVDFDVSEGLGEAASNSSLVFVHVGGFNDQKVTAVMKYVGPTAQEDSDIGVLLRLLTLEGSEDTYYYVRVDGGVAKITKVIESSFTTLTSQSFPLPQDTEVTITTEIVGDQISATFQASGLSDVNLSATDGDDAGPGIVGFRSLNSSVWCRSFSVEQL